MAAVSLKCVAIDDEPLALELIRKFLSRIPGVELLQTFEDAVSGAEYLGKSKVDLLFLDVNMPDITGLDLARSLEHRPIIIFTTAYKKFAFEGFELEALDYLLKPINFERFSKAVNKAIEFYRYKQAESQADNTSIYVYSEYRMVQVLLRDIEYIESMEDYIRIHFTNAKPLLTLMPLKKILEKLPAGQFKRIHRSYIVQLGKVKSIHNRKVQLSAIELPVSATYAGEIMKP